MTEEKKKIESTPTLRSESHHTIVGKINPDARYRVSVFRSNKIMQAQIIDDKIGNTITSASTLEIGIKADKKLKPSEIAFSMGKLLAEKAKKINVKKIHFDRRKYQYHGRIKSVAEGMRDGGLQF